MTIRWYLTISANKDTAAPSSEKRKRTRTRKPGWKWALSADGRWRRQLSPTVVVERRLSPSVPDPLMRHWLRLLGPVLARLAPPPLCPNSPPSACCHGPSGGLTCSVRAPPHPARPPPRAENRFAPRVKNVQWRAPSAARSDHQLHNNNQRTAEPAEPAVPSAKTAGGKKDESEGCTTDARIPVVENWLLKVLKHVYLITIKLYC